MGRTIAGVLVVLLGCPGVQAPSAPRDDVVVMDLTLDLARQNRLVIDRPFTFYAGPGVQSFAFRLTIEGLHDLESSVDVMTAGGDMLQHLAGDVPDRELTTQRIDGNVGVLRVRVPDGQPAPRVVVRALEVTIAPGPALPVDAPAGPRVTALALAAGAPVEVPMPARTAHYFLVPAQPTPLDVLVFGGGDLLIADPATTEYPLSGGEAWERVPAAHVDPTQVRPRLVRFPAGGPYRLALTTIDIAEPQRLLDPQHARLLFTPVAPGPMLAFPSPDRGAFLRTWIFHVDRDGSAGPSSLHCKTFDGTNGILSTVDPPDLPDGTVTPPIYTPRLPMVCYDGHEGTDFPLRFGPLGQVLGVPVSVAAPGIVVSTDDGHGDSCFKGLDDAIHCPDGGNTGNFVGVHQDDGLIAFYFHLRRDSVLVAPGDRVACGQLLGEAASSGDSAAPHLHFELEAFPPGASPTITDFGLFSVRGQADPVDPYPSMWQSLPANDLPSSTCP